MNQSNADREMFDAIERDSWHASLMEKTRERFFGMSDSDIRRTLRDMFDINLDVIVTYCMSHLDDCFGKDYIQVALDSGLHNSSTLGFAQSSPTATMVPCPNIEHVDCSPAACAASDAEHAASNFEYAVRNDKNFMPYCHKLDIDPDDDTAVRGYAFSHTLVSKVMFFFIAGALVFPLVWFYWHTVATAFDLSAGTTLAQKAILLRENTDIIGGNSKGCVVYLLVLAAFQAVLVFVKIQNRIFSTFVSGVINMFSNLGIVLRGH
jgi:hypothetical protein